MNQHLRPGVSEPVILMFSRRQVETGDIEEHLLLLGHMTAGQRESCRKILHFLIIQPAVASQKNILINKSLLFILYERNPDAEKTLARSLEEFEGAPAPHE